MFCTCIFCDSSSFGFILKNGLFWSVLSSFLWSSYNNHLFPLPLSLIYIYIHTVSHTHVQITRPLVYFTHNSVTFGTIYFVPIILIWALDEESVLNRVLRVILLTFIVKVNKVVGLSVKIMSYCVNMWILWRWNIGFFFFGVKTNME